MKRKSLLSSIVTIALCLSLIAGSTFALFTSTSQVDIAVTSGAVELNAGIDASGLKTFSLEQPQAANRFAAGGTAILQNGALLLNKIVPGDRAEFPISVINRSNVDVQYRVLVNVSGELANGLVITAKLNNNTYDLTNPLSDTYADKTQWFEWKADQGASRQQIDMVIELPKEAGNEFQRKNAYITVIVEAVQANAEIWDGSSADTSWHKDNGALSEATYRINNAAQLAGIGVLTAQGHNFEGKTIVLDKDINLNELPWTSIDGFGGTFDGNGHTISGLYIDDIAKDGVGLFGKSDYSAPGGGVQNLTVDGAFVRGHKWVGVLWGHGNATQITNCTVKNATVIATEKRVGALTGYVADESKVYEASIDNNVVENCAIYYAVESDKAYDIAIGTANGVTDVEVTASTNTITPDCTIQQADRVIVGLKDFFAFAKEVNGGNNYSGKTVKLHTDINLRNILWTPVGVTGSCKFRGVFDGQGHTVSNLYVKGENRVGLFGDVQGTVKNINVETARVSGTKNTGVIVGYLYGNVTGCSVTDAIVEATPALNAGTYDDGNNAGVIVGYLGEGTVTYNYTVANNTVSNAVVAAYRALGGVIGTAQYNTQVYGNTVENVSLAYLPAHPYKDGDVNDNVGDIVGRDKGATIYNNHPDVATIAKDIYLTRPVDELIAGNAYAPITKAGVYEIEENMFFYDKMLMSGHLQGDVTINGNGKIVTYNDAAGVFNVDYNQFVDEGLGYQLKNKGLTTINDLTILSNLACIYLGHYQATGTPYPLMTGGNPYKYEFNNVRVMNLETEPFVAPTAIMSYAVATFNNCTFVGSVDVESEYGGTDLVYDMTFFNYSDTLLNNSTVGNILTWEQCSLEITDSVVERLDSKIGCNVTMMQNYGDAYNWSLVVNGKSQIGTLNITKGDSNVNIPNSGIKRNVYIGADAVVDTLTIPSLTAVNPARVVIEGTVNHFVVGGVETTYAAWVAAYNAAMNP